MKSERRNRYGRQPSDAQLSRWLACGLLASSVALGAVVSAQSQPARPGAAPPATSDPPDPVDPSHPAAPTAPPAFTPDTRPPPEPRTPVEVAMDASIAERVRHALATDHITRLQPIDIEVTRGITNLSGSVTNAAVAQRALSIARATGGVTAVQDAMKVEETRGRTEIELRPAR